LYRFAWIASVTKRYEDKGWSVNLRTRGSRDHVELKLVGQQLLFYRVTFTDEAGSPQMIIRSTSRCSEPRRRRGVRHGSAQTAKGGQRILCPPFD
jgi:hypothetical protein